MDYNYDVVYIGSGQATWNGATTIADELKIAVIEEAKFGGVCSNYGCNAKIVLDHPVELLRKVEAMQQRGVSGDLKLNWEQLMNHKHEIIDPQSQHNYERLTKAGITVYQGHAEFKDAHTLQVGDETITADKIVIATGQRPNRLDVPGAQLMHNSADFLSLAEMPERVTIIGGGYIGLEFATIAQAAGADVTVITRSGRYLSNFPKKYVNRVIADLKRRGVKFIPNQTIEKVTQRTGVTAAELVVWGENDLQVVSDYVIDATGRIPNNDRLNLEAAGVRYTPKGIPTNNHLQTNIENIYAAGDIIDSYMPKITPLAAYESRYLAREFTDTHNNPIEFPVVSTVSFTSPRIAQVGVSLDMAEANSNLYRIVEVDFQTDWFRQVGNETEAYLTLIFDERDVLVGATEMSHDAVNSINSFVPYIQMGLDRQQLQQFMYLFPSIEYTDQRRL